MQLNLPKTVIAIADLDILRYMSAPVSIVLEIGGFGWSAHAFVYCTSNDILNVSTGSWYHVLYPNSMFRYSK